MGAEGSEDQGLAAHGWAQSSAEDRLCEVGIVGRLAAPGRLTRRLSGLRAKCAGPTSLAAARTRAPQGSGSCPPAAMQRPRSGARAFACCEFRCLVPAKGFGHAIGASSVFVISWAPPPRLLGWATIGKLPPARHFPTEPVAAA